MNNINKQIKSGTLKPVYLLCGQEDYLKRVYRDRLKKAALENGSDMNCSTFSGKQVDPVRFQEAIETLPFFAPRRFVLVEDSGLFHTSNEFSTYIEQIPDTTVVVFVEHEVDKRNKLYKAVKEHGYISEMNGMEQSDLKVWIGSYFAKEGKRLTEAVAMELIERTGGDMELLLREMEKLSCYAMERDVIAKEDLAAVCTTQLTSHIFQMIDDIAAGRPENAMKLYQELLALKERPMTILYLITKHFNRLMVVKEMKSKHASSKEMASALGIPPFAVSKHITQAGRFSADTLRRIVENGIKIEENVKKGRLFDQIGVELLIVGCKEG